MSQHFGNQHYDPVQQRWYREVWKHTTGEWTRTTEWVPEGGDAQPASTPYHQQTPSSQQTPSYQHVPSYHQSSRLPRGQGVHIQGTYDFANPQGNLHYESLDHAFYVRPSTFFDEGKVFSMLFTETAGSNAAAMAYNDSVSMVKYNEYAFAQIQIFVVVRRKREFCFACPIFDYDGRGTTKPGVVPSEHAIIYSYGHQPQPILGERGLVKEPIAVVMREGASPLHTASRVYFGIHHPIQYNVKVKDLGYVHPGDMPKLLGYWRLENSGIDHPTPSHTASTATFYDEEDDDSEEDEEDETRISGPLDSTYELVRDPKAFFKKGKVFMTRWAEPRGGSERAFVEIARFAVVRPNPTFSVCLRISTYSGQATTKPGVAGHRHAAVIPVGGTIQKHHLGENIIEEPIEVKIENTGVTIDPMSRINFAKPYTVEHNVKVRNIGRIVGDSIGRLDYYFAQSLGHTKS